MLLINNNKYIPLYILFYIKKAINFLIFDFGALEYYDVSF